MAQDKAEIEVLVSRPPGRAVARALVDGLQTGAGDAVFGGFNDLVLVVGPGLLIEYANRTCEHVLGWRADALVGRAVSDLIHPGDLPRALEAERRVGTTAAAPAVGGTFRLRHADGSWREVELDSGRIAAGSEARAVVLGRVNSDFTVQNRILALLTEGAPIDQVVELVPSFGTWRQPTLPFAVAVDGPAIGPEVVGTPVAVELLGALVAAGWWEAGHDGEPRRGTVAELTVAGRALAAEAGFTDWAARTVETSDGATSGFVTGWTTTTGPAIESVEESVRLMTRATGLILEWHRHRDALEHAAHHDTLTGVANRRSLFAALAGALAKEHGDPVAVLYLDLDRFKQVNDTHGHDVGDVLLVAVVRRMEGVLRPGDVLGRMGGDEFVIVCRGLDARSAAEAVAHAAIDVVSRPFQIGGRPIGIGLSVGVAVSVRTGPGVDADDLLARADGALYVAKSAGGGRVVVTSGEGGLDARDAGVSRRRVRPR